MGKIINFPTNQKHSNQTALAIVSKILTVTSKTFIFSAPPTWLSATFDALIILFREILSIYFQDDMLFLVSVICFPFCILFLFKYLYSGVPSDPVLAKWYHPLPTAIYMLVILKPPNRQTTVTKWELTALGTVLDAGHATQEDKPHLCHAGFFVVLQILSTLLQLLSSHHCSYAIAIVPCPAPDSLS